MLSLPFILELNSLVEFKGFKTFLMNKYLQIYVDIISLYVKFSNINKLLTYLAFIIKLISK